MGVTETSYTFPADDFELLIQENQTNRGTTENNELDAVTNFAEIFWYVRAVDTFTDGSLSTQNPDAGTVISFNVHQANPPATFSLQQSYIKV